MPVVSRTATLVPGNTLGAPAAGRRAVAVAYCPAQGTGHLLSVHGLSPSAAAAGAGAGAGGEEPGKRRLLGPRPPPLRLAAGLLIVWRLGGGKTAEGAGAKGAGLPLPGIPGVSGGAAAAAAVAAVLVCEGAPTCATWGPRGAHHVVVAGTAEGALVLWDLREPAGNDSGPPMTRGDDYSRCTPALS